MIGNDTSFTNLLPTSQYVYDLYLSKPYSDEPPYNAYLLNREFQYMDNGHPGVVYRPNHGLVHTLRVASYIPVVIQYLQSYSDEKDNYNFSADQIEKIQIALLFAVVGRKNEWGFADNKKEYMKFRENCVIAFKQWCQEYPHFFSEVEIQQYSESVFNFGDERMKDPISRVMRIAHKIDLLRCYKDEKTIASLTHLSEDIGEDKVLELLSYAGQCIKATGDKIVEGKIVGLQKTPYDPSVFPKASKDPQFCLSCLGKVPAPQPQEHRVSFHR